jgi:hypothetical protein
LVDVVTERYAAVSANRRNTIVHPAIIERPAPEKVAAE